jgi:hypothetical protein
MLAKTTVYSNNTFIFDCKTLGSHVEHASSDVFARHRPRLILYRSEVCFEIRFCSVRKNHHDNPLSLRIMGNDDYSYVDALSAVWGQPRTVHGA